MIKAQELLIPQGHMVLFPIDHNVEYCDQSGEYKTPMEAANEASQQEINPLVFAAHPCMNIGFLGKFVLRTIQEPAWRSLGMTQKTLEECAQAGILDGIEDWNTAAGTQNENIQGGAEFVGQKYGIPLVASSDTATQNNVLTSYLILDMDFSDPMTMRDGFKASLTKRAYEITKGTSRNSMRETLQHVMASLLMYNQKKRMIV